MKTRCFPFLHGCRRSATVKQEDRFFVSRGNRKNKPDSCINPGCNPFSTADLQDEIHPGVVIPEFTGSAVLGLYCRSGLFMPLFRVLVATAPSASPPGTDNHT